MIRCMPSIISNVPTSALTSVPSESSHYPQLSTALCPVGGEARTNVQVLYLDCAPLNNRCFDATLNTALNGL